MGLFDFLNGGPNKDAKMPGLKDLDEKYGFRDLKFETPVEEVDGLLEIGAVNDAGDILYSRPSDSLKIGEADLSEINYVFYKGVFSAVTLNLTDYDEFNRLAEVFLKAYGPPGPYTPGVDSYLWSGALASIFLHWNIELGTGFATIRSVKLRIKSELDRENDAQRGVADL